MGKNETTGMDFILLGLFPGMKFTDILIGVITFICVAAFTENSTLILLILLDSQLHMPVYFLLGQLSLIDLLLISTTAPKKMAIDFFSGKKIISNTGCGTQMFFFLMLGGDDCILLTLMSWDGYVAICYPLRHPVIICQRVCLMMVLGSWAGGALDALVQTAYTMHLPKCGPKEIEHFCEILTILSSSCEGTSAFKLTFLVTGMVILLIPFVIIFSSYSLIFFTVLHMNSPKEGNRALATSPPT
ncbi:olfactory receptor 2T33-like [Choloepus didactylus]|uniref:olfactory receptor 2T33-like n=1 Tax=Choloepus didactylus TaxID=27675 RepID=UPI00189DB343|nr:olfactory receptor 2T33-like [Choloepus didactylus]